MLTEAQIAILVAVIVALLQAITIAISIHNQKALSEVKSVLKTGKGVDESTP